MDPVCCCKWGLYEEQCVELTTGKASDPQRGLEHWLVDLI